MLNKYLLRIVGVMAMAVIFGCGSTALQRPSTLDKNWGRSFESAKYHQILNHNAAKKHKPVVGLDGAAGENNMGTYRKSFAAETPSPDYNINLSGIGGVGGGR
jgi:hypothetical protein